MLALSHLVAGGAVGLVLDRPGPLTVAALASHAFLDGIGHDDGTLSVQAQGVLSGAALIALAACWGPRSPVVLGALAGAAPDAEVAADKLFLGGRGSRYLFPSHWQLRREQGGHPYRYPGPGVPIAVELVAGVAGLAALCAVGVRRRRAA